MKPKTAFSNSLWLIAFCMMFLITTSCKKTENDDNQFNYFCETAPEDWQCHIVTKDFEDLIVPDSIDIPVAIIKYTNYSKTITAANNNKINPSITIYLYRINDCCETKKLKKYIDQQSIHSSCIPIYYGETTPHYIVTSPCLINNGIFSDEAKEAMQEMHDALKILMVKYNLDLIDN